MIFGKAKKIIVGSFFLFLFSGMNGSSSFAQENFQIDSREEKPASSQVQVGPNGTIYSGPAARYNCYADCRGAGLEIAFCMRACGLGMMEEP